jgi:hypothetical protein
MTYRFIASDSNRLLGFSSWTTGGAMTNRKMTYWQAVRSFCRGADGLTAIEQIDRNIVVIKGNVKLAVMFWTLVAFATIVKMVQ